MGIQTQDVLVAVLTALPVFFQNVFILNNAKRNINLVLTSRSQCVETNSFIKSTDG